MGFFDKMPAHCGQINWRSNVIAPLFLYLFNSQTGKLYLVQTKNQKPAFTQKMKAGDGSVPVAVFLRLQYHFVRSNRCVINHQCVEV